MKDIAIFLPDLVSNNDGSIINKIEQYNSDYDQELKWNSIRRICEEYLNRRIYLDDSDFDRMFLLLLDRRELIDYERDFITDLIKRDDLPTIIQFQIFPLRSCRNNLIIEYTKTDDLYMKFCALERRGLKSPMEDDVLIVKQEWIEKVLNQKLTLVR